MKYLVWLAAIVLALVALLAVGWWAWDRWADAGDDAEWTSRSAEALDELEQGIEDYGRRYYTDAWIHFERAAELDSEQPGALIHLYEMSFKDAEQADGYFARLDALDPDRLNDRERFLIDEIRARRAGDVAEVERLIAEFRAAHPEDLYGLVSRCSLVYQRRELDEARRCYEKVVELFPNWVEAHDSLGFLAMAEGRFDEAEERFRSYRFLAPDQATPYSSLGQLQVLLGRYDEAERMLLEAIRVKGDYCEAWFHLIRLYSLAGSSDKALDAIDRLEAEPACGWYVSLGVPCAARAQVYLWTGREEQAREVLDEACLEARRGTDIVAHRLAVLEGDEARARELERRMGARIEEYAEQEPMSSLEDLRGIQAHMEGVRQLVGGDVSGSIESFREADGLFAYWNTQTGTLKLFNRMHLAEALARDDRLAEARSVYRQIEAVNPRYADDAVLPGLERSL